WPQRNRVFSWFRPLADRNENSLPRITLGAGPHTEPFPGHPMESNSHLPIGSLLSGTGHSFFYSRWIRWTGSRSQPVVTIPVNLGSPPLGTRSSMFAFGTTGISL